MEQKIDTKAKRLSSKATYLILGLSNLCVSVCVRACAFVSSATSHSAEGKSKCSAFCRKGHDVVAIDRLCGRPDDADIAVNSFNFVITKVR